MVIKGILILIIPAVTFLIMSSLSYIASDSICHIINKKKKISCNAYRYYNIIHHIIYIILIGIIFTIIHLYYK
jgi:hypothetical protein